MTAMNDALFTLLPAAPELVLALGAMALLMLGAFRGEETAVAVNWLAIALLVAAGAVTLWLPNGTLTTFGGSFVVDDFARFLKLLAPGRQLFSRDSFCSRKTTLACFLKLSS